MTLFAELPLGVTSLEIKFKDLHFLCLVRLVIKSYIVLQRVTHNAILYQV